MRMHHCVYFMVSKLFVQVNSHESYFDGVGWPSAVTTWTDCMDAEAATSLGAPRISILALVTLHHESSPAGRLS